MEFTGGRERLQLGEAGGAGPEKTERMRVYQEGDEGHPRGSAWQEGCSAAGALLPSGGQRPAAELHRGVRRVRFVPVLKGRPRSLPSAHSFSKHVPSQAHVLFASQDTCST